MNDRQPSNKSNERQSYKVGFEAGKKWASVRASISQLERLDNLRTGRGEDGWSGLFEIDRSHCVYSAAEEFVLHILGNECIGNLRIEAFDFWDGVTDGRADEAIHDGDFVNGFAQGALRVWQNLHAEL